MTYERFVELVHKFDEEFLHTEFIYCGVDFWPVIRTQVLYRVNLQILYDASKREVENHPRINWNVRQSVKSRVKNRLKFAVLSIIAYLKLKQNKNLIISFDIHSHLVILPYSNGEKVNPYTFGFEQLLSSYQRFDLTSVVKNKMTLEYFVEFYYRYHESRLRQKTLFQDNLLKNIQKVNLFLKTNIAESLDMYDHLLSNILENQSYYLACKKVFSYLKPLNVWGYNYNNNRVMAISRVCSELNINFIENQHSVQSDLNPAYMYWPNNGKDNSPFFPNFFWVWTETDKKRIERNFANVSRNIKAILGGNLYVTFLLNRRKKQRSSNKILIALPGGLWLPDFIIDYIVSDLNYKWYIRLHPRYQYERELVENLKKSYPHKIEIEEANEKPLFELFDIVDYHITSHSGTAFEAQAFNVQNIIYSEIGQMTFKEHISSGAFYFVDSFDTLNDILKERRKSKRAYDPIIANPVAIKENFRRLFGV